MSLKYVPVFVRLPILGAQLAALRGRRKLFNPGEEQQTLVAGVPLQLGGNRLHPRLVYRKNPGKNNVCNAHFPSLVNGISDRAAPWGDVKSRECVVKRLN